MGLSKTERRARIRKRIRKVSIGTAERPRLSVFRSNKELVEFPLSKFAYFDKNKLENDGYSFDL